MPRIEEMRIFVVGLITYVGIRDDAQRVGMRTAMRMHV